MQIEIIRIRNYFGFNILDNKKNIVISSSGIGSNYNRGIKPKVSTMANLHCYAWDAQKEARELLKKSYHVEIPDAYRQNMGGAESASIKEISTEEQITDRYLEYLHTTRDELESAKGNPKEEKNVKQKIDLILQELEKIRNKLEEEKDKAKIGSLIVAFKKLSSLLPDIKTASSVSSFLHYRDGIKPTAAIIQKQQLQPEEITEILEDYGYKACKSLKNFYTDLVFFRNNSNIVISNIDGQELIELKINNKLCVNNIIPSSHLKDIYPEFSIEFYQKFWRPIVEALGHFYIDDFDILISPTISRLPDAPKDPSDFVLDGWDVDKKQKKSVLLSFRGKKPIWLFDVAKTNKTASAVSKYTEQNYLRSIVKCTDRSLESIYGRSGVVIQVIPLTDMILLDVDFGEGLENVRLSERQIQIVA